MEATGVSFVIFATQQTASSVKLSTCDVAIEKLIGKVSFTNKKSNLSVQNFPPSVVVLILIHIGLIKHNNQLCPHRYPFTPGWREAIMVKYEPQSGFEPTF